VMNQLVTDFAEAVDMLTIYVSEAHPREEWALDETSACVRQPKTLDERNEVAQRFAANCPCKVNVFLDGMDNTLNKAYGAEPERLFVVDGNGNLAYCGGPGPFQYDPHEVRQFLEAATSALRLSKAD